MAIRPPLNIGLLYMKIFVDLHLGQIPVVFKTITSLNYCLSPFNYTLAVMKKQ